MEQKKKKMEMPVKKPAKTIAKELEMKKKRLQDEQLAFVDHK
jgi:hypothetical protein